MKNSVLVLSLLAAIFLLAGCDTAKEAAEKAQEKAMEEMAERAGEEVDIDLDKNKMSVKKKDGGKEVEISKGKSRKNEEGLPGSDQVGGDEIDGVPRYPGSVKTDYVAAQGSQMNRYVADAQKAEVESFYKKEMKDGDWKLQAERDTGQEMQMLFKKGNRVVGVIISPSSRYRGNTAIELTSETR